MLISEVVARLTALQQEHSDVEVQVWHSGLGTDRLSIQLDTYSDGSNPGVDIPVVIIQAADA